MANPLLTDNNLKNFIESLKLSKEQEAFLVDELPKLNEEERMELLSKLKDVYLLNMGEKETLQKIKNNLADTPEEEPGPAPAEADEILE